jgi:ketosteroid isomerase-like protein
VVVSPQNDNLALARRMLASFARGDLDAYLGALSPDVEAHPSLRGGPTLRGREAVADWLSQFTTGDLEARALDYEVRGDCVVIRAYLRSRDGSNLAESQFFWVCQFKDGQVVRMESHPSRESALASC